MKYPTFYRISNVNGLSFFYREASPAVPDAVADNEGAGPNWKARRAFRSDRPTDESAFSKSLLSLVTIGTGHVGSDPAVEGCDPDRHAGQADIHAGLQVPDAGHFAPDIAADDVTALVKTFAANSVPALVRRAG